MKKHPPLLILDVETLGLGNAPVWEVFALRVVDGKVANSDTIHMFVEHDPALADPDLPEQFREDYRKRYIEANPLKMPQAEAVQVIRYAARGKALVLGSNPSFDMQRLEKMAADNDLPPLEKDWHYNGLDVPTLAHGWLIGKGVKPAPPWKSDLLSQMCGVDPRDFPRHTAEGDVMWTWELWKAITS